MSQTAKSFGPHVQNYLSTPLHTLTDNRISSENENSVCKKKIALNHSPRRSLASAKAILE